MKTNKMSLGKKDFVDGVCFVLEEMFLMGYEEKDAAISLLKHCLFSYKKEIFNMMKKNNPDIFKDTILPELKIENLTSKK